MNATRVLTWTLFPALALAAGCPRYSPPAAPAAAGTAAPATAQGQSPQAAPADPIADVPVLTEADAEIMAAADITPENADAEFDRLMGEIEGEAAEGDEGSTSP